MHPQQQQQDGGQLQQLLRNRPMSPQSGPEPTAQIQSQGRQRFYVLFMITV